MMQTGSKVLSGKAIPALIVVSVGLIAPLSGYADEAATKKAISAQLDGLAAAYKKKDINGVQRYLASDFVEVDAGGAKHTRAQYIEGFKQAMNTMKAINSFTVAIQSFKMNGAKVVLQDITKVSLTTGSVPGTAEPKNKTHTLEMASPSRQTWVQEKGTWLMQKEEDLPGSTMKIDGKELNFGAMPKGPAPQK